MPTPPNRRTSISPSATALTATNTTSSSASTNLSEAGSPSPYFLPELILLVAIRLTTLQDFLALRAVCRTYRALLTPSSSNLAFVAPRLLVAHEASNSKALFHARFHRLLRFCTRLTSRDPTLTRFYAFGCCIVVDDRTKGFRRHRELRITHLLTGEQDRLPNPRKDFDGVIFSGDLVLTFKEYCRALFYCRIGDVRWRKASWHEEGYQFHSLVFVKGTLYGMVFPKYRLAVVQLHNNFADLLFLGNESTTQLVQGCSLISLAECRDKPLVVVSTLHSPQVYHVFEWQFRERKWARTTSLGGCSLFFRRRQFAGCVGPDHPAVRRDCLYFNWCSGYWSEYSLVDGSRSLHKHVADYPGRAAMVEYVPLACVLPSTG